MKRTVLILLMAATAAAASAQTPARPAAPAAKAATAATAAKPATATAKSATATVGTKLPPGVPAVRGMVKTAFSLRYQEIKIGTGAEAEPYKMYKVHYTGWLQADGRKFDSSYDHPRPPVLDKDGKPALDADGKPQQGEAQPISFPVGFGRVIPGWDQGFYGMKIGGKRRLFIPWQLAYGAHGHPTGDPKNPGIPPKADLIFDVELVDVTDLQMPANHPGMSMMPGGHPMPGMSMPKSAVHAMPATPDKPAGAATPAQPAAPAAAPAPAAPAAAPSAPTAQSQPK